ncbi:hypothetical protein QBC47DRAFT_399098 [Echria macrotheca]|uniref:Uncharacterized protein n=1 Tax=Echria macrotheca TaxID=438768 RepID=A0AAJ0BHR4_9PEZI|nr:hypothetical protein QBC47DRAFT_399098 [Echria macrotheca]
MQNPTELTTTSTEPPQRVTTQWGRTGADRSWSGCLIASAPLFLAPVFWISIYIILAAYDGSLSSFLSAVVEQGF